MWQEMKKINQRKEVDSMGNKIVRQEKNIKKIKSEEISEYEIDGYREVYRCYKQSGKIITEKEDQEILKVKKFFGKVAEVECESGLTISLGEGTYEFAKVGCKVKLPCYVEEILEAQKCAFKIVEEGLIQQIEEVKQDMQDIKNKYSKAEEGEEDF
jgi:hypothetical protein